MHQHSTDPRQARSRLMLNIFALPNQTTILVVLLVATLFGFLLAVSFNTLVLIWPLTLTLVLLSFRRLLAWPERETWQRNLELAGKEFQPLQDCIARLSSADKLALKRVPRLVLSSVPIDIGALGALRRWYIVIDQPTAGVFLEKLQDPAMVVYVEAVILHELYHFKNGDNFQVSYARDILGISLRLFGWAAAFFLGMYSLIILTLQDVLRYSPLELAVRFDAVLPGVGLREILLAGLPSMVEWEELQQRAVELNVGVVLFNVFANTYALTVVAGVVALFLWRKILRMREFYADAGAAHVQREIFPLFQARARLAQEATTNSGDNERSFSRWSRTSYIVREKLSTFWLNIWGWWVQLNLFTWLNNLLRKNVSFQDRIKCLCDPTRVYGTWSGVPVLVGLFVLVLDILLSGTSALIYIGQWPLHFSVLAVFLIVSLYMVIWLVIGRPVWRDGLKAIGLIMAFRAVIIIALLLLLAVTLVVNPTGLTSLLEIVVASVAGYSGFSPLGIDPAEFVVQASISNLVQLPTAFLLMLSSIWGYTWVIRHVLTWYGYLDSRQHVVTLADTTPGDLDRQRKRWLTLIYVTLFLGALMSGLGILPLITDLVLMRFDEMFLPGRIIAFVLALFLFVASVIWFRLQHRRYAQCCPHCGTHIPGYYELGKRCPTCDQLLHPWLFAEYTTEYN